MQSIKISNLSVAYDGRSIIQGFSLAVAAGESILLKGPSGCGKSTILHAVCGLIPGSIEAEISGEISLFGENVQKLSVAERAGMLGIVFQNPETQLFCDSVEDEIAFGLENLCIQRDEIARRIDEMLALVGLAQHRAVSPSKLSGGQKQLVVLASVLALDPKILLLDEALSGLDEKGKQALKARLATLKQEGRTLLMVDHEGMLETNADRVVDLERE